MYVCIDNKNTPKNSAAILNVVSCSGEEAKLVESDNRATSTQKLKSDVTMIEEWQKITPTSRQRHRQTYSIQYTPECVAESDLLFFLIASSSLFYHFSLTSPLVVSLVMLLILLC